MSNSTGFRHGLKSSQAGPGLHCPQRDARMHQVCVVSNTPWASKQNPDIYGRMLKLRENYTGFTHHRVYVTSPNSWRAHAAWQLIITHPCLLVPGTWLEVRISPEIHPWKGQDQIRSRVDLIRVLSVPVVPIAPKDTLHAHLTRPGLTSYLKPYAEADIQLVAQWRKEYL